METLSLFIDQVWAAPSFVWTITLMMSAISGYMLQNRVDDWLFAVACAGALFILTMIAQVAFVNLGVTFTDNKDSNIVAASGAAACSVTLLAILLLRMWYAVMDARNRLRGAD